jgi:hypothetical protein
VVGPCGRVSLARPGGRVACDPPADAKRFSNSYLFSKLIATFRPLSHKWQSPTVIYGVRLVASMDFLHHCASEMGHPACCEDHGEMRVVW